MMNNGVKFVPRIYPHPLLSGSEALADEIRRSERISTDEIGWNKLKSII